MTVAALSTAGFSNYLAASTNVSASQKAWQSLQQSLSSGNLSAAQTAFNTYNKLNQNLATTGSSSTTSSSSSSADTTLATDMKALGAAIGSGDLSTAQSAFATVQSDLKTTPSQAMANAESAVAQTVQWVDDLLTLASPSTAPTTPIDSTTAILDSIFGLNSNSNSAYQNSTNATTSILDNAYGLNPTGSSSSTGSSTDSSTATGASAPTSSSPSTLSPDTPSPVAASQVVASPLAAGNAGNAASVNVYA